MFVAHGVPYGPADVWVLSDFLTAALFATLVGVGAALQARPQRSALLRSFVRGAILVVLGLLLERAGAQVVVILVHLGVLTWIIALLRPLPSPMLAATALWLALISPALRRSWLDEHAQMLASDQAFLARTVELVFVGSSYRLTTLSIWAILGLLAGRHLLRARSQAQRWVGASLLLPAALAFLTDRALDSPRLVPYSGSLLEIGFNALLSVGVLLCGASALNGRRARTLARMGQMSVSLYALHVLWLALLAAVVYQDRVDDSWWTFASLVGGCMAVAMAWSRVPRHSPFARGPLEGVSDRLASPFARG